MPAPDRIERGAALRLLIWLCLTLALLSRIEAVVFFSTGDPEFNTAPPSGALTNSGFELQGYWELFLGTPVGSNYFISAKHIGGSVARSFVWQGRTYTTIGKYEHPVADLTLWKVSGTFPGFAQIYTNSNEKGRPIVVLGRGLQRGPEIRINGELKGWQWGGADFRLRWGENVVSAITDRRGNQITSSTQAQCLRATFDMNAGPNEAHLSNGDSGGGLFIQENGVWKLAGINVSVDGPYNTNTVGRGFGATLFEERGFYRGGENRWTLQSGPEIRPGAFHAIRISTYSRWIQNVVNYGNSKGQMFVEHSALPGGPFTMAGGAQINGETQTIRVPLPGSARFYRLRATERARITSITNTAAGITLTFQ